MRPEYLGRSDPERAAQAAELGAALERALAGRTVKSRLAQARGALRAATEVLWP